MPIPSGRSLRTAAVAVERRAAARPVRRRSRRTARVSRSGVPNRRHHGSSQAGDWNGVAAGERPPQLPPLRLQGGEASGGGDLLDLEPLRQRRTSAGQASGTARDSARSCGRTENRARAEARQAAASRDRRPPRSPPPSPRHRATWKPVTPCSTTSASAPFGNAITGVPLASASMATSEPVSATRLGIRTQRAAASRRRLRASPTGPMNRRRRSRRGSIMSRK